MSHLEFLMVQKQDHLLLAHWTNRSAFRLATFSSLCVLLRVHLLHPVYHLLRNLRHLLNFRGCCAAATPPCFVYTRLPHRGHHPCWFFKLLVHYLYLILFNQSVNGSMNCGLEQGLVGLEYHSVVDLVLLVQIEPRPVRAGPALHSVHDRPPPSLFELDMRLELR